jgi:hypothetical protein
MSSFVIMLMLSKFLKLICTLCTSTLILLTSQSYFFILVMLITFLIEYILSGSQIWILGKRPCFSILMVSPTHWFIEYMQQLKDRDLWWEQTLHIGLGRSNSRAYVDVTYHLIKKLLIFFSNNEVMNALGIVYPQY